MLATKKGPVMLVVGTRPEGIKMVPVYFALKQAGIDVLLCSTTQHDQLLTQALELFDVKADFNLGVMRLDQSLFYMTQSILQKTKELFVQTKPSVVVVQGDTTSTMAASLSAFYLNIPIVHIEAGLRTDDIRSPFPEEMNRRFVTTMATYHCAPTELTYQNLIQQGVDRKKIFCTGNTVVDALRMVKEKIALGCISVRDDIKQIIINAKKNNMSIILFTAHRRESFGDGLARIFTTIKQFLKQNPHVICIYPYHPNPQVIQAIQDVYFSDLTNIILYEPLLYQDLVYILEHAECIITDSGGIQEEAVSLGKKVIILREKTERMEGVLAGLAFIVGTDPEKILRVLQSSLSQEKIGTPTNVYGDGFAAEKIVPIIKQAVAETAQASSHEQEVQHRGSIRLPFEELDVKKICVVGLGYIGLPTAILTAGHGFDVMGVDIDAQRVEKINAGDPVIQEPEVFEKLRCVLNAGRFRATTIAQVADFFIIAVPTPCKRDKTADLSFVFNAITSLIPVIKKGNVIILESTVPVGTTKQLAQRLQIETGLQVGIDIFVAHCPERVLPGNIFYELINNARIIGGIDRASVNRAAALYKEFVRGDLHLTDAPTAELVKLVENSSRDTHIAFAHQVASMAYSAGLNPYEIIELANKHPRVNILNPTCGVGGHCIAIDPWFLIETFPKQSLLLKASRMINDAKPIETMRFVQKAVEQWQIIHEKKCTVLVLGLTYKADVDDIRESPALLVARHLAKLPTIDLLVCEPHISQAIVDDLFEGRAVSLTEGLPKADMVVFLVAHKRFKVIDPKMLASKKVLDFCGILHKQKPKSDEQEYLFWPVSSNKLDIVDDIESLDDTFTNKGQESFS